MEFELQSIVNILIALIAVVSILVFTCIYLVFRLRNIDPFAKWDPHNINGWLMLGFLIVGLIIAFISSTAWFDKMILVHSSASVHGDDIDSMMWITLGICILVVIVVNGALFYYSWRYRQKEGQKATYYPHNNTLEYIWTAIPGVVMTLLVIKGIMVWDDIMRGQVPENAIKIEMTGEQFKWTARYPGADLELGEAHVSFIEGANVLGLKTADKDGHDDLIIDATAGNIFIPVGVPIDLDIRSKDVLHSLTLAHFRVKMDAVPGMTTRFSFTAKYTTEEMRERTGNEEFEYEMSCQQICGASHFNMKRIVKCVTMDEYQAWLAEQKPYYETYLKKDDTQAQVAPESSEEQNAESDALVSMRE